MDKLRIRVSVIAITLTLTLVSGCTLPGFSTPTPFTFPTPDKTMTALFEPTSAAPATSAATQPGGGQATSTPQQAQETNTPTATEEVSPTPTEDTTPSITPTQSLSGPSSRGGVGVKASRQTENLNIDGDLYEWDAPIQKVITHVVYGKDKWSGELDASGTLVASWDADYLYLGFRVKDDKYVQKASGKNIFKGDSVEILFDGNVSSDYFSQIMNWDDYQIGVSPGKNAFAYIPNAPHLASVVNVPSLDKMMGDCDPACPTKTPTPKPVEVGAPVAYLWAPASQVGHTKEIKIGVLESGKGYQVEMRIPWDLLGVTPQAGAHYGFAVSISDNDKTGSKVQQTMVSNVPTRVYNDPTTWGDLYLEP